MPCRSQCPRVYLQSTGLALESKDRLLGCFRLMGSKLGDIFAYYQNMNKFFLTPDAVSTPFSFQWLISEQFNPFSGGIKNDHDPTVSCPHDGWEGWEVDTGNGVWMADETLTSTCHYGDEGATTNATPPPPTSEGTTSTNTLEPIINGKRVWYKETIFAYMLSRPYHHWGHWL